MYRWVAKISIEIFQALISAFNSSCMYLYRYRYPAAGNGSKAKSNLPKIKGYQQWETVSKCISLNEGMLSYTDLKKSCVTKLIVGPDP